MKPLRRVAEILDVVLVSMFSFRILQDSICPVCGRGIYVHVGRVSVLCAWLHRPEDNISVFFYHSPPYSFEMGSLTEPWAHKFFSCACSQQAQKICLSPPLASQSTAMVVCVLYHSWPFTWVLGNLTFGSHLEHKYFDVPNHLPSLKMPFWVDLIVAGWT